MTYNRIIIVGIMGTDAETKGLNGGKDLTVWNVATHDREKGTYKTTWHRCLTFDANDAVKLAKKRQLVLVEGRLAMRSWTDQDGATRLAVEIITSRALVLGDAPPTSAPDNDGDGTTTPTI